VTKNISSRAHVITGSFGAGKTTAIRWLMAHKPPEEFWVVILNEFNRCSIDALSVAESANGSYDVRLVAAVAYAVWANWSLGSNSETY